MELNIKFNEKMLVETANRVLDEFEYNGKTIREWADSLTHPKTNADRIRAMSGEELATWLNTMQSNAWHSGRFAKTPNKYPSTNQAWLDWLKQEAET